MNTITPHAPLSQAIKLASKAGKDSPCALTRRGDRLLIEASGEAVRVQTAVPVDDPGPEAEVAVMTGALSDALRRVGGSTGVLLRTQGRRLSVEAGASAVQIPTIDADQPTPDLGEPVCTVSVSAGDLRAAIEGVAYAISTDEARYGLNGACLRGGRLLATDGHRAASWRLADEGDGGRALLPPAACGAILAALATCGDEDAVTLTLCAGWHRLEVEGLVLDVRAVDGEFPDLGAVLPKKEGPHLRADRDALIAAIQTVDIGKSSTRLDPDGTVSQRDTDSARDARTVVGVQESGGFAPCGMSAAYLLDALRTCAPGDVVLWMAKPLLPCLVDDGTDAIRVVMPRRLD